MIVAIPVGANHVPQAISLLNWLAELDGGSRHPCLLVIAREISYESLQELLVAAGKAFCNVSTIKSVFMDKRRQPDTENLLFRAVCDYNSKVTKQPFFWLALDAVPTSAGWLDRIEMDNQVKAPAKGTLPKDYPLRSAAFQETIFAKDAQSIEQLRGNKSGSPYKVLRPEWPKVQRLAKRSRREPSVTLIYIHVPGDEQHWKYAREFVETYGKFQPQYHHKTVVVCQGKPATPLVRGLFKMMPNLRYFEHDDSGWDIGAFIAASREISDDCVVCLGGSAHFKRDGWLKRIAESWQKHGAGFYGATPTHEVSPHLCTSGFWCPPEVLSSYPIKVVNRVTRYDFEHGPNACWKMVAHNGLPVKLVTWDGEFDWQDWRKPPNIYRRGDQSNALIYWHHFQEYEKASPQQKAALSKRSDTLTDPHYLALLNPLLPEIPNTPNTFMVSHGLA